MKTVKHNCKQNDGVIKVMFTDQGIEELWVKIKGETSYTIIGYRDLEKAISSAIKKMSYNKNVKHTNFSSGYIGEAEISNL